MEELAYSARGRIESIILRAFSAAVVLTGIEVVGNALIQNQYLNPLHWVFLVLVVGSQLAMLFNTWVVFNPRPSLILFSITPVLTMFAWPLLVTDVSALPSDYQPWLWWAMGMAAIAAAVAMPRWIGFAYIALVPIAWFLFRMMDFAGSASVARAAQDASLIFFLGAVFGSLILLLFSQGREVDIANTKSLTVAVEQAQIDARERERGLVEALVHDRVLNTLLVAKKAKTETEFQEAKASAKLALEELQRPAAPATQSSISSLALFRALRTAAYEFSGVTASSSGDGALQIPGEVAEALTQATLQAIDNSRSHSGAETTSVILSATKDSLEIRVTDTGKGFRPARVAKNRLGLRLSIIGRVESVGGWAKVDSVVGEGTTVVVGWKR